MQYNLPSTWDGMKKRQLGPELLTKWWSEAPAKLAGLSRQKGSIEEGFDADLMVSFSHYPRSAVDLICVTQYLGQVEHADSLSQGEGEGGGDGIGFRVHML